MPTISITGDASYDLAFTVAMIIVAVTVVAALFIQTPYGRFAEDRWGLQLDPRVGWWLMELPASLTFPYFYLKGPNAGEPFPIFIAFVWACHYANRGWIMSALMRVPKGSTSSFSLMVVMVGWVVTSLHGYLNATWASSLMPVTGWEAFGTPAFIVGVGLYYSGLMFNLHSDHVVRTLRTKDEVAGGEKVYRIPKGGLFRYVTNAPYFTELWLWIGFAIFTGGPGGIFIFAISVANLLPRAFATHRWYVERFDDYPSERKILIPFLL